MFRVFFTLFFLYFLEFGFGQQDVNRLFMPLEYQQAYENRTRSYKGVPGINYTQNIATYALEVKIDPATKKLEGLGTIRYTNNNPDSLYYLVIRLHQNMYEEGSARDRAINVMDVTEGVRINSLSIEGEKIDLSNSSKSLKRGTNLYVRLPRPVEKGSETTLKIEWELKIPEKTFIRMGALSESTMFIGYWYPQISVYDDIYGWDILQYGGWQEFYQQNANFEVAVTVPAGYGVWATGELTNPDEVYSKEINNKLKLISETDTILTLFERPEQGLKQKRGTEVWQFRASEVPDFAIALSNEYTWDATSAQVDSASGRALIHTVYNPKFTSTFKHVALYSKLAMQYFTLDTPCIAYPYPQFTTFQGLDNGGMEYPMMANNGVNQFKDSLLADLMTIEVTAHEIAHTYMPFLVGVNERRYTWMEEGWATVFGELATRYIQKKVNIPENYSIHRQYLQRFLRTEGTAMSVPPMVPSIIVRDPQSHYHVSYYKAYFAYLSLKNLLGDSLFLTCLQTYMNQWTGKSPTPYDFFYSFNETTNQNLNWFWNDWFFELGYPDLSVQTANSGDIIIKNPGGLPIPFKLEITFSDDSTLFEARSTGSWADNQGEISIHIPEGREMKKIHLITDVVPDVNPENNIWMADK